MSGTSAGELYPLGPNNDSPRFFSHEFRFIQQAKAMNASRILMARAANLAGEANERKLIPNAEMHRSISIIEDQSLRLQRRVSKAGTFLGWSLVPPFEHSSGLKNSGAIAATGLALSTSGELWTTMRVPSLPKGEYFAKYQIVNPEDFYRLNPVRGFSLQIEQLAQQESNNRILELVLDSFAEDYFFS